MVEKKEPDSDLKILSESEDTLELEFVNEDIAFVYALRDYIVSEQDIEFCSVKKDHPEIGHPQLFVKGKNLRHVLKKAFDNMSKDTESLMQKTK